MSNRKNSSGFDTSDIYKHQLDVWYRAHNISFEKIGLFYDLLNSMFDLVEDTFLGADVLLFEVDQKSHFVWCWKKTLDNFANEKIYFKPTGSHFDYLWHFFLEAYYFPKLNNDTIRIKDYLFKLFDFTDKKTRSELDMLAEVYKLLDQNLKK